MRSQANEQGVTEMIPEKLITKSTNNLEKRRTSLPGEKKGNKVVTVCLNDLLYNGKPVANITTTPKEKTRPKQTQQPQNGVPKDQKPPLKSELLHSKSNGLNQYIKNIAKVEKAFTDKPKTSISPHRTTANQSKTEASKFLISKAKTNLLAKNSNITTAGKMDQTARPKSKAATKPKKESKIEDDEETHMLSEKLAQFSKQNLNSRRPKFTFGKSKKDMIYDLNLDCLFVLGKKVSNLYESLCKNSSIYLPCREYIQISIARNRENFEKLFKDENLRAAIKNCFIIEKICIITVLYCFIEDKTDDTLKLTFKSIIQLVYQNMIIFLEHLYCRLISEPMFKSWKDDLMNVLSKEFHSEQDIFDKREEYLERMKYNSQLIKGSMKKICSSYISNKELHYCINMIMLQADKITVEEGDKRLLDSFSLYVNEKEMKAVDPLKISKPTKGTNKQKEIEVENLDGTIEPYLPPVSTYPYTLVIDLDETLVHYAEIPGQTNELRIRPHAEDFLNEMAQYYEIVVFTAAMKDYADWAIDNLDKNSCISYRLYRHHASVDGNGYAKDLSRLGRDLAKMIIVDNLAENFKLQPDNGIFIKAWYDDPEDTALVELSPLLKEIAIRRVKDVRRALKSFREQMMANIEKGIDDPHLHLKLDPDDVESD